MSSIDQRFQQLKKAGQKAFIPFITAGDPDLATTAAMLRELAGRGASICELGIPYSDPIADGPVIQDSYCRALAKKIKLTEILAMLRETAPQLASPTVTMVSYAIVLRHGLERYVADAKSAGVAGLIVPDLLVEESAPLAEICRRADVSLIQLVTPTTSAERARRIAETSTGFIYYVSVTGITGEREALPQELVDKVAWLKEQTQTPVCIGFGISRPEQVRALAPMADGLIVGSALVRRMHAELGQGSTAEAVRRVGDFAATLIEALKS